MVRQWLALLSIALFGCCGVCGCAGPDAPPRRTDTNTNAESRPPVEPAPEIPEIKPLDEAKPDAEVKTLDEAKSDVEVKPAETKPEGDTK